MATVTENVPRSDARVSLQLLFEAQRAAIGTAGPASAAERIDRLDRCIDLLVSHETALCEAASSDFGQRPAAITRAMDILPSVLSLKHARRCVRRWMRPRRRRLHVPLLLPGTRAEVVPQPLGVVGVLSPWNFPIGLVFGPLAGILAAGNRCLVKPSELTPQTSALMQQLVAKSFDPNELAIVTGGADVAEVFSALPFDHLLFTGSTAVGRQVMTAAARNLVPVTLELGGKCPAIVGRPVNLARVVDRIFTAKLANAGQMCLAPDYACIPRELSGDFVSQARLWVAHAYPGLPSNPDYTSIVSDRHVARLHELLADARAKGAEVIELAGTPDAASRARRLVTPALVLNATDRMRIMQEEVFGPILPLQPYDRIEDVISYVNRRDRPLALYYFGSDRSERDEVLARTTSGGVTFDDIAMHYLAEDLPFGGIGASGMGAYHGERGFLQFSHSRAVLRQTRFDFAGLSGLRPPYGRRLAAAMNALIRK